MKPQKTLVQPLLHQKDWAIGGRDEGEANDHDRRVPLPVATCLVASESLWKCHHSRWNTEHSTTDDQITVSSFH